ncbi:hypothetical protein FA014_01115 [Cellulomonas hominis]|uniref:ORC1/DEAH AAA+ ATPase domain-containing protein n=1 Tax=Cellulomonas hominis TaxID=156981 RepID=A0A7Z8NS07_9CELL|nr:hypothetical protein FA014_01115 [Cellulomonas hominis]
MCLEIPRRPKLTLTTAQGWREFVDAPPVPDPPRLTVVQLERMPGSDRERYDLIRRLHHANLGPFETPAYLEFKRDAMLILGSNVQDGTRLRPSFGLQGEAGTGKSTAAKLIGRDLWREQVRIFTELTAEGQVRVPVTKISMKGSNTERAINEALAVSYTGTAVGRGSAPALDRFCRYAREVETVLIIVDDFHFLDKHDPEATSNHFKGIAEEVPATFVFVGVGLAAMELWDTERLGLTPSLSQTARRWPLLTMDLAHIRTPEERKAWITLLHTIDDRIVLAKHEPGTLQDMAELLYEYSQGHMQTLFDAINQATYRAITTGTEQITEGILEKLPWSKAAIVGREQILAERAEQQRKQRRAAALDGAGG